MTAEELLLIGVALAVAVVLGILIVYRTVRKPLSISPILEQRLLGIETAIGRSAKSLSKFSSGVEIVPTLRPASIAATRCL